MSLVLTLLQAPRPQPVRRIRLDEGALVIGRGAEADWRIDDPDLYVSRAHCTITGRGGQYEVTDTSTGGLFLDDASQPLGPGRSMRLLDGTRLRLGDYVLAAEIRAEIRAEDRAEISPEISPEIRAEGRAEVRPSAAAFEASPPVVGGDDFFNPPPSAPQAPRPPELPDPFETAAARSVAAAEAERRPPLPEDDPFLLDPGDLGGDPGRRHVRPAATGEGAEDDWTAAWPAPPAEQGPAPDPDLDWPPPRAPRAPATTPATTPAAAAGGAEAAALAAFLRGLGVDPAEPAASDPLARLEAYGREHRMMVEGLMLLLRKRSEEKGEARIAQTVVGQAEVNPLKFMPTAEDALAVMAAPRSRGFCTAEAAIAGAVRDLAAHHIGAWRGVQGALRRMIDRFDPAALEREVEALGLLETLLAGGRGAKLWALYRKRFAEIARSAETRFLGEVGADFRDAYETREED